jgi:two-component system OmpR family response regulator
MNAQATDSTHLVVVEDDIEIGALVRDLLQRENFRVSLAGSGAALDAILEIAAADLIVLDLMLPGEDGLSICRRLRRDSQVPIMMLTAKGEDIDRIIGLELGADDYLAKPFNPRELLARIRAVLRRTAPARADAAGGTQRGECVVFAGYRFDRNARTLHDSDGGDIELSSGDFDLLCAFTQHPQRVLSRDQLMDLTKGRSWEAFDRSIDVALSRLRRKIEPDPTHPQILKTVRNGGYLLAVPVEPI